MASFIDDPLSFPGTDVAISPAADEKLYITSTAMDELTASRRFTMQEYEEEEHQHHQLQQQQQQRQQQQQQQQQQEEEEEQKLYPRSWWSQLKEPVQQLQKEDLLHLLEALQLQQQQVQHEQKEQQQEHQQQLLQRQHEVLQQQQHEVLQQLQQGEGLQRGHWEALLDREMRQELELQQLREEQHRLLQQEQKWQQLRQEQKWQQQQQQQQQKQQRQQQEQWLEHPGDVRFTSFSASSGVWEKPPQQEPCALQQMSHHSDPFLQLPLQQQKQQEKFETAFPAHVKLSEENVNPSQVPQTKRSKHDVAELRVPSSQKPVPKKRQLRPPIGKQDRCRTPDCSDDIAMTAEAQKATAEFLKGLPRHDARALKKALKKGLKKIRHGRIIVIGPGRSGKSALIRSLLREIFKHTNSTIGMDIRKTRCFARSRQDSLVFEAEQDQFQQKVRMAYNAVIDMIDEELAQPLDPGRRLESETASHGRVKRKEAAGDPSCQGSPPGTVPEELKTSQDVLERFVEAMQENNTFDKEVLEMLWHLDIWDFAGQKPFEVLQHMFLTTKRCAYIIVFDATKLLMSQYNDEFCDADGKNHDLDTGCCSYFRAFESWLNIVQEVVGDDISVPVYAVGTHIDGIPVEKRDQELAKIEEFIWSSADKRAYYQNIRKIFFVDNTLSGSEVEDPQISTLRTELIDGIEDHCTAPIPVAWMPFAPAIDAVAKELCQPILPLEQVRRIARKVCQDPDVDIDGLLDYHHQLGQIIPVHLRQEGAVTAQSTLDSASHIVINPDWMMTAAAVLFSPQPLSGQAQQFRRAFKSLFDDGVLVESLAIHRWECNAETATLANNPRHRQAVFSLLQKFAMVYDTDRKKVDDGTSSRSRKFLIPALVTRRFDPQHSTRYHVCTPPYYIVCGHGQSFPEVLFWCSVVRLMEQFQSDQQPLFYKRMARLLVEYRYWLQLTLHDKGITMTMESEQQDDMLHLAAACRQVYEKLSLALCDLRQVALRYLHLFQAVCCQCSATRRKCVEHAKRDCQEMMCSHFATLPLLAEDVRKQHPSRPPVFRCPEKSKLRAVVANQAEMKMYWLPSSSEMGATPEEARDPAPQEFSEPTLLQKTATATAAAPSLQTPPAGRKKLLRNVQNLEQIGDDMALFLDDAEREKFAKLAVEFHKEDINNYRNIIRDSVRRHGRCSGEACPTNVPGVLFYLTERKGCTLDDLHDMVKKASPRNSEKTIALLWNEM